MFFYPLDKSSGGCRYSVATSWLCVRRSIAWCAAEIFFTAVQFSRFRLRRSVCVGGLRLIVSLRFRSKSRILSFLLTLKVIIIWKKWSEDALHVLQIEQCSVKLTDPGWGVLERRTDVIFKAYMHIMRTMWSASRNPLRWKTTRRAEACGYTCLRSCFFLFSVTVMMWLTSFKHAPRSDEDSSQLGLGIVTIWKNTFSLRDI